MSVSANVKMFNQADAVTSTAQGDALILVLIGSTDPEVDAYLEAKFTDRQLKSLEEAAQTLSERAYLVQRRRAARS